MRSSCRTAFPIHPTIKRFSWDPSRRNKIPTGDGRAFPSTFRTSESGGQEHLVRIDVKSNGGTNPSLIPLKSEPTQQLSQSDSTLSERKSTLREKLLRTITPPLDKIHQSPYMLEYRLGHTERSVSHMPRIACLYRTNLRDILSRPMFRGQPVRFCLWDYITPLQRTQTWKDPIVIVCLEGVGFRRFNALVQSSLVQFSEKDLVCKSHLPKINAGVQYAIVQFQRCMTGTEFEAILSHPKYGQGMHMSVPIAEQDAAWNRLSESEAIDTVRHTVVLRNVTCPTEQELHESLGDLVRYGFINYTEPGPTEVDAGMHLLRGHYEGVVLQLIGRGPEQERLRFLQRPSSRFAAEVLRLPSTTREHRTMLRALMERRQDFCHAVRSLPMYIRNKLVQAVSERVWNHMASCRVRSHGARKVVVGDMVLGDPSFRNEESVCRDMVTTVRSDAEAAQYTPFDIVLPIPYQDPLWSEEDFPQVASCDIESYRSVIRQKRIRELIDLEARPVLWNPMHRMYRPLMRQAQNLRYRLVYDTKCPDPEQVPGRLIPQLKRLLWNDLMIAQRCGINQNMGDATTSATATVSSYSKLTQMQRPEYYHSPEPDRLEWIGISKRYEFYRDFITPYEREQGIQVATDSANDSSNGSQITDHQRMSMKPIGNQHRIHNLTVVLELDLVSSPLTCALRNTFSGVTPHTEAHEHLEKLLSVNYTTLGEMFGCSAWET